jgi:hypothetical protein
MEHGAFDMAALRQFMRGLVDGGPSSAGHRTPCSATRAYPRPPACSSRQSATRSRRHFHREDRHAIVLQGTWWTGTGDEFAPDKTVPLKAGSYMMHPAGAHHFDGAKDEDVILQLIGMGPSETTRLRPQDGLYGRSRP